MVIPMGWTTFWTVRTKGMIGNTKDMCEFVIIARDKIGGGRLKSR